MTNAVNIPTLRAEDLEALSPYVPLAAKLGRLAMELAQGRAERIELTYYGALSQYDTRLLTVAALNGAFEGHTDQPVNYVNAPLIAAERGIDVAEERKRSSRDFTNLVRVAVDDVQVAGTTIGREHRQWLVSALGFELEMELAPLLVVLRYDDVPGVIGRVGTLFGEGGVNIANMTVSRTRRGGKALMVLSIDTPVPPELAERLQGGGFDDARCISLRMTPWPAEVERVAVFLRKTGRRRASRSSRPRRRPPPTRRGPCGCDVSEIVKSLIVALRRAPSSRSFRATGAATWRRSRGPRARGRPASRAHARCPF